MCDVRVGVKVKGSSLSLSLSHRLKVKMSLQCILLQSSVLSGSDLAK